METSISVTACSHLQMLTTRGSRTQKCIYQNILPWSSFKTVIIKCIIWKTYQGKIDLPLEKQESFIKWSKNKKVGITSTPNSYLQATPDPNTTTCKLLSMPFKQDLCTTLQNILPWGPSLTYVPTIQGCHTQVFINNTCSRVRSFSIPHNSRTLFLIWWKFFSIWRKKHVHQCMHTYMQVLIVPILFSIKPFMWKNPEEYTKLLLDTLASHPF